MQRLYNKNFAKECETIETNKQFYRTGLVGNQYNSIFDVILITNLITEVLSG